MKAYSDDIREKVLKALHEGQMAKEVAKRFDVCISWVYKIKKRFELTGSYKALPRCGAPRKMTEADMKKLALLVKENPSATLDELKELGNFSVGRTTIYRALNELDITYKKKMLFAAEQNREDVKQNRQEWVEKSQSWDINNLVFLDESSIKTSMVSLYGWGLSGERVKDYVPDARWKSLSILSSLRIDGSTEAMVYEGGLTGDLFKAWLKECLLPTLRKDDIVIMDNMSSHKVEGVQEIISSVGARIEYLPPYSPDFNPVEHLWSKVKKYLRKVSKTQIDELRKVAGESLNKVTRTDALGWYKHCGYSS